MARKQRVADTQLAFDLWGEFDSVDQEEVRVRPGDAREAAGDVAGDARLSDEARAVEQRPDGAQGDAGRGRTRSVVAGTPGRERGVLRAGSDGDGRPEVPVQATDRGGVQADGAGVPRVAGGSGEAVRVGRRDDAGAVGGLPVGGVPRGGGRDVVGVAGTAEEAHGVGQGDSGAPRIPNATHDAHAGDDLDARSGGVGARFEHVSRVAGGVSAVRTLQRVLSERRRPTRLEEAELQRFPGWGATPELFDPKHSKYQAEREALTSLWGDEEWAAARRTVLNAHYTNDAYVDAMWQTLDALGVPETGHVLEPGCGTGNFIKGAGTHLVTGVELDPTSAAIAQVLHPAAIIRAESFGDTFLTHDGYDAVIGNVPFGQTRLYDPAYNRANLSLHNHFIVKALRQTKPGGIVLVMSSRWTMDAKAEQARREISLYGELLGAVRMPAGAHGETAGTDAIVDVLVLRRHIGDAPESEPAWLKTVDMDGEAGTARVNSYFAERPGHVLGTMGTRVGQFGPEVSVSAVDVSPATVAPLLADRLRDIVQDARDTGRTWAATGQVVSDRPVAGIVQDPSLSIGHISVQDGVLVQQGATELEPVNVPKNAVRELTHLVKLREAAVRLLEAEASSAIDTDSIVALRQDLNHVYDSYLTAYGPIGRSTTTVRERPGQDPIITRRFPAAIRALRIDPHYATVAALEHYNDDTETSRKATIFTERVVGAVTLVDHVDTPEDAIRVSLERTGYVDMALVASLLDVDEAAAVDQVADLVFLDPEDNTRFLPAAEYLSGNVRRKLKEVRELAVVDAVYERHVDALTEVIPEEVGPAEIDVRFGAGWVPVSDVSAFLEHELKRGVKTIERIDGEWKFQLAGKTPETVEAKWGVSGDHVKVGAAQVMKKVMNGEKLELRYRPDADSPYVLDQVATESLQERAGELHETFQDWLWRDGERVVRLQERYNDMYNGIALRSYDGVELVFPGKAKSFTPRPHQHAAVARMLAEPAVGLFHEVGAGKTAEMVLGVMELKRLGMADKPAIVVPNQMLEQFTREFKQIYPRARVLSAGSDDIARSGGKDGRKLFVARARSGDWDAVILTHGAFGKIGLGAAQADYSQQRLDELRDVLEQKLNSELSEKSVKKMEKALAAQEEKLKRMLDLDHDGGVSWDETGIDYLCIDEAHLYKNMAVASLVDDLSKPGNDMTTDLDMKLWYHREHLGQSRVATLATATPLPNSIIEMYVMMRYLRPDLLKDAQVYSADDWAQQFTEQVTAVEAKPDGGGFQVKTRTTKFRNVPELLRMWHVPGDVKTQADLALPVPLIRADVDGERAPEMVIVPATEEQNAGMGDLVDRGDAVRRGTVRPEEDNMLKITSNGRALALDARLYDGGPPAEWETTKVEVVANNVYEIWAENKDREYLDEWGEISKTRGALQIVFADLGTPSTDGRWDAYTEIREQLIAKGVPASQVRFIHEAGNDKAKAELFQQARDGRVQVLFGSTGKMGVGTNVQARAVALHHIDAPWRPADVTQREGRAIRQGNQNDELRILRYATEGSFDSYMWGTLARKATFIDQVLTGRLDVREVENSTEMALQFSEMQAIAAGDMRILEAANLKNEVQKLSRQERAHSRKISSVEARRLALQQSMEVSKHDLQVMQRLVPQVVDTRGDNFTGRVKPSSWAEAPNYRERKQFGQALKVAVERAREQLGPYGFTANNAAYPRPLNIQVSVAGLDWETQLRWNAYKQSDPIVEFSAGRTHKAMQLKMAWSRIQEGDESGLAQSFELHARDLPRLIVEHEETVTAAAVEVTELKQLEQEEWPKRAELGEAQSRLADLLGQLEAEAKERTHPQSLECQIPAEAVPRPAPSIGT
ncbi:N12 class adenine-specific DNA methylase [Mycolicibacterium mucogenicum 261Sha1.1M5]|nr:N12 class adenine-specific DNA methylase [Mycolicibacterium mucogenicum 261Sha1.1M5]